MMMDAHSQTIRAIEAMKPHLTVNTPVTVEAAAPAGAPNVTVPVTVAPAAAPKVEIPITVAPAKAPDVKVDVHNSHTVKGYPGESTETVTRDDKGEMTSIKRVNKD